MDAVFWGHTVHGEIHVLKLLFPSGQTSPADGIWGWGARCWSLRISVEVGDPLMRCGLSNCPAGRPPQDLLGVQKAKQAPCQGENLSGFSSLPGVPPWGVVKGSDAQG